MAESCIIDLRELGSKASERRFMTAFLETIYRKAGGEPFHLVVDEADLFAPQKPSSGDETLLGLMENIVRRGRVKGFVPWLISQRPAVVNKNVLSQMDGLVAFKLTSSQDRDALDAWIEGQADKAQGKAIKDELPAMQVGEGVVWLPAHGVLKTVQFPPKFTFDSSRAPKRGEKQKRTTALAPLDLGSLKDRLATVEAEAKANDPKALRTEIAKLRAEKAKLEKQVGQVGAQRPAVIDKGAIAAAEKRGEMKMAAVWFRRGVEAASHEFRERTRGFGNLDFIHTQLDDFRKTGALREPEEIKAPTAQKAAPLPTRPARAPSPVLTAGGFTGPQARILRSLAMWRALGHETPTREMVAAVAGYKPTTGTYRNLLSELGTAGHIGKPESGKLSLLVDGVDVMSAEDGRDLLLGTLGGPEKRIIAALLGRGARTREEVAEDAGYQASTGTYRNLLSSLSTLRVLTKPLTGYIELAEWAQELLEGWRLAA